MHVLLDSNIFISALLSHGGAPAAIYNAWLDDRFQLVTCQHQIDEIRVACRNPKYTGRLQPSHVGTMLNNLYRATVWPAPIPRKHKALDPTDSYLLDLIDAAQPDYAVTGDKRAGLLQLKSLGGTRIFTASTFCESVLQI
jgi:putative PIN family toxin of toxin-antitoxin system